MTTRSSARHRKATRPLTPISHIAPATRRGLVVAASSGLALTMIASGANAASSTEVAASAGSLQQTAGLGALTADAREAVTVNDAIVTGDVVAPADLTDVSGVTVEAPPAEEPPAPAPAVADDSNATTADSGATTAAASSDSGTEAQASNASTPAAPPSTAGGVVGIAALKIIHIVHTPNTLLIIPPVIPLIPCVILYRLLFAVLHIQTISVEALLEALRFGVNGVTIILAVVVGVSIPNIFIQKRMEAQQQREISAIIAQRETED